MALDSPVNTSIADRNVAANSTANRRRFVQTCAGASLLVGGFVPYIPSTQPVFANRLKNDRPTVGCIGLGGMGTGDAHEHHRFADIVAVCDVDSNHLDKAKHDQNIGQGKADAYSDYRRVLERSDIQVISIATPDHWHIKIALEALAAGKHVFCQKPLTLTLEENQLIRRACEKHPELVFMVGTQQRSDRSRFLRAVNMVQRGLLGPIQKITVGIDGGSVGGPFPVSQAPAHLDWNQWLGPAPLVEYREKRCHNEFRWWYEYSGGKFTDWGAHHIDIAQWAINEVGPGSGPVEIDGTGAKHPVDFKNGYPVVDDHFNTSHEFDVVCKFSSGIEMTVTSRPDNGVLFVGEKGKIFVNRGKITGLPIEEKWDDDQFGRAELAELYKGKRHEGHKTNFYRCIAEGGLPVSDVFSHVQVMNTCHLVAIASRLGRKISWNPKSEKIEGDDQASSFFSRVPREGFEYLRS